jgi:hypothetical protein
MHQVDPAEKLVGPTVVPLPSSCTTFKAHQWCTSYQPGPAPLENPSSPIHHGHGGSDAVGEEGRESHSEGEGGGAIAVEPERGGVPCPNVDRGEATVGGEETVEHGQGGGGGGETRVRLTVGNRPVYRGNRPYRPGPVTVPAGYQPLGLGNFEFEFQKLKIVEKIPKNTS